MIKFANEAKLSILVALNLDITGSYAYSYA